MKNFALNTNTDCFRRRLCCHSTCPRRIRCYISALLFSLPATSTSCPHAPPPIPLTYSSSSSGRDTARFCLCVYKQTDTNLTGSNNLWGVTSGSPFPYFLCYPSLRGCHSGPDRWRRKERGGGALHKSVSNVYLCLCR